VFLPAVKQLGDTKKTMQNTKVYNSYFITNRAVLSCLPNSMLISDLLKISPKQACEKSYEQNRS